MEFRDSIRSRKKTLGIAFFSFRGPRREQQARDLPLSREKRLLEIGIGEVQRLASRVSENLIFELMDLGNGSLESLREIH